MFIMVKDANGIEFLANMSVVKMVRPIEEGSTLTAIDGTSCVIKESVDDIARKISDWAFFDERTREGTRNR